MSPEEKLMGMIGLSKRGKYLVYGENLAFSIKKKKIHVVFIASDAAKNSCAEIEQAVKKVEEVHPIEIYRNLSKEQLGNAIGHGPVAAVGIMNSGIGHRIMELEEEITNGKSEEEL